jgi:hypothetical protein
MTKANWTRAQRLYMQCDSILADDENGFLPEPALDRLAESIDAVSSRYLAHRHDDPPYPHDFIRDALDIFGGEGSERDRFDSLYNSRTFRGSVNSVYSLDVLAGHRRRPTPFESLVETARRLRDVRSFRELLLRGIDSAGFVGGSTSYGRFFNVTGAHEDPSSHEIHSASDLDVLVIVPEDQLQEVPDRLKEWSGSDLTDVTAMANRLESYGRFCRSSRDARRSIFSHKIRMWHDAEFPDPLASDYSFIPAYMTSIHLCTPEAFEWLTAADLHRLGDGTTSTRREIKDFRETESVRNDAQRDFAGRNVRFEIQNTEFENSWVRTSFAFRVTNNGCYHPGFFQNLILPMFDLEWDFRDVSIRDKTADFRNKIQERLREERRNRPFEHLQISFSHARREVFAPHVVRHVDFDAERA